MIKEIEELYENADGETEGFKYCWNGSTLKKLDRLLENVPQEAWIQ